MTTQTPTSSTGRVRSVRWSDVLRVLVRGAPFAATVTAIAVATAVFVTRATDPVYSASVSLVALQDRPEYAGFDLLTPPTVDPGIYRAALYEGDVLRRVFERIEGRSLGDVALEGLVDSVRVAIESQVLSSVIRVDVRDTSPERAAAVANAIAEELVAWDQQRARSGLDQGIAALERSVAAIDEELRSNAALPDDRRATLTALRAERSEELGRARDAGASAVTVGLIEPLRTATTPEVAVGPRLVLNVAIAGLLGLVAGYGLLLIAWSANPRIASREDLERIVPVPVLATFPKRRPGFPRLSADASSLMRTRLSGHRDGSGPLFVVLAGLRSPADQDGVAVGLAESFARIGERTLLVDADLRHARATAWLDVGSTRVTAYDDVVEQPGKHVAQPIAVIVEGNRSFDFLPAFPSARQPVDRLVQAFRNHAPQWTTDYDVIIVDAPPVNPHPDLVAVVELATGVVLCARTEYTTLRDLQDAVVLLAEQGVPLLGTVLTAAPRLRGESGRAPATGSTPSVARSKPTARRA